MNAFHFSSLDPSRIGKKIARGGHHDVYEYGKNKILKVPHRPFRFLYSNKQDLENDMALINSYFPGLAVNTKFIESSDKKLHAILQDRLKNALFLTPHNAHLVDLQLKEIISKNNLLLKEHAKSLDFLGGHGYRSFILSRVSKHHNVFCSNLMILPSRGSFALKLVDTELLRLRCEKIAYREIVISTLSYVSWIINKRVFSQTFNYSLG